MGVHHPRAEEAVKLAVEMRRLLNDIKVETLEVNMGAVR